MTVTANSTKFVTLYTNQRDLVNANMLIAVLDSCSWSPDTPWATTDTGLPVDSDLADEWLDNNDLDLWWESQYLAKADSLVAAYLAAK